MGVAGKLDSEYFLDLQTMTGWGKTLTAFAEWCQPQKGWLALDIGCGPGLLPALFQRLGCIALGIDMDDAMFAPQPLHPLVAHADGHSLPFPQACFNLVTASNLLFLLADPRPLLFEVTRVLKPGGEAAFLNPSELLTLNAAIMFADQRNLQGLARDTFLNWAARAEKNHRWDRAQMIALLESVGLTFYETELRIGAGFARFSRARL